MRAVPPQPNLQEARARLSCCDSTRGLTSPSRVVGRRLRHYALLVSLRLTVACRGAADWPWRGCVRAFLLYVPVGSSAAPSIRPEIVEIRHAAGMPVERRCVGPIEPPVILRVAVEALLAMAMKRRQADPRRTCSHRSIGVRRKHLSARGVYGVWVPNKEESQSGES